MGRVYVPVEDLDRFGCTVDDLERGVHDGRFVRLMRFQTERTRQLLDRGRALAQLNRRAEADAELARAVAQAPADPEVWIERGSIYAELGQLDRAGADFARATDLGPGDAMVWYRRAVAGLGSNQTDGHLRLRATLLGRVLARKPNDPEPWLERGKVYAQLSQWEKAVTDCGKAIERDPGSSEPWVERARAYAQLGRWRNAAADFARVIDKNVSNPAGFCYAHTFALLGSGDVAAYRRACEGTLARYAATDDRGLAAAIGGSSRTRCSISNRC